MRNGDENNAKACCNNNDNNINDLSTNNDNNNDEEQDMECPQPRTSHDDDANDNPEPPSSGVTVAEASISSTLGAVANLCSATLGAGILALPFGMYQSGLVGGMILLVLSAWATIVSIDLLIVAVNHYATGRRRTSGSPSYEDLVQYYLGKTARRLTQLCILVFCLGVCVAYLIAVGDILEPLVGHGGRTTSMVLVWACCMLPLSLLRTMEALQSASVVGIASIGFLILAALHHAIVQHQHHHDNDDATNSTMLLLLNNTTNIVDDNTDASQLLWPAHGKITSLILACPMVLFAFSSQVNVCAIYQELPHKPSMHWVTRIAIFTCAILYTLISCIGLYDFGSHVAPNLLQNYHIPSPSSFQHHDNATNSSTIINNTDVDPNHDNGDDDDNTTLFGWLLMVSAFASMAIAVTVAFPLNIFPARVTLEGLFLGSNNIRRERNTGSLEEPLLHEQQDDNASSSDDDEILSHHDDVSRGILSEDDDDDDDYVSTATSIRQGGKCSFCSFLFSSSPTCRHYIWTLGMATIALGLSLIIPNISVVFGLLGGTTTSMLGFILPGALGLQTGRRIQGICLIVSGTIVGILATAVTLYTTIFVPLSQPTTDNF